MRLLLSTPLPAKAFVKENNKNPPPTPPQGRGELTCGASPCPSQGGELKLVRKLVITRFVIMHYELCIMHYALNTIQHYTFNIKNYASCIVNYELKQFHITNSAVAFQATGTF